MHRLPKRPAPAATQILFLCSKIFHTKWSDHHDYKKSKSTNTCKFVPQDSLLSCNTPSIFHRSSCWIGIGHHCHKSGHWGCWWLPLRLLLLCTVSSWIWERNRYLGQSSFRKVTTYLHVCPDGQSQLLQHSLHLFHLRKPQQCPEEYFYNSPITRNECQTQVSKGITISWGLVSSRRFQRHLTTYMGPPSRVPDPLLNARWGYPFT